MSSPRNPWKRLTALAERDRFAEIMRMMDRRYRNLSLDELDRWVVRRREKHDKQAELFGWFDEVDASSDGLRQVIAVTSFHDEAGNRSDLGLSMLGFACDKIPESAWTEDDIRRWLARFVICVKHLVGLETSFRTMRPKSMTYKPMERMHDLMREGIYVQSDDPDEGVLHSGVYQEKDLGHTLFWKMRTVCAAELPASDPVVDAAAVH